jgi:hypothetical protein
METQGWAAVAEALSDLDFPATKEQIVQHAERRGADQAVQAVRALPLATYDNLAEVRRSVPLDRVEEEGQTATEKARQARSPHSEQIAEQLRTVEDEPVRHRGLT